MPKKFYYKIRRTNQEEVYSITKFDEDLEVVESYTTSTSTSALVKCSCPSYKKPCKHRKMIDMFNKANQPDKFLDYLTGQFYSLAELS